MKNKILISIFFIFIQGCASFSKFSSFPVWDTFGPYGAIGGLGGALAGIYSGISQPKDSCTSSGVNTHPTDCGKVQ